MFKRLLLSLALFASFAVNSSAQNFTLQGGNFQVAGVPVANGSVILTLSNPSATICVGGGASTPSYTINLDANGNMPLTTVLGNSALCPQGTFYTAQLFTGASGGGSLISTSTWIVGPSAPYSGTLYPNVMVLPAVSFTGGVTVPSATVAFSATPTFNAATVSKFYITLTGNVTSSTLTGSVKDQLVIFVISEDGVGGRTFAWPTNVKGQSIATGAGLTSTQAFTSDGTNLWPIGEMTVSSGTTDVRGNNGTLSSLNTIQMADQATGTDWCAKTLAALAANNEAFVNQNSTPGSCTTNITMPSGSVIHFIQAGHYVLSTFNIIPGTNTNVVCDTRGVVIDYSGTGAAWDDNTVTGAETNGCTWNALTSSPVALLRVRNTGNSFNMNVRVRAKLSATTYSAGQIGLLLQGDGATSANYRSTYDVETDTLDIGGRNVSLVNNQSPNGNIGVIKCNGHTVCLDAMDMTDSMWTVLALGAHTAGTAIRLCATGNGGSGVSNDFFAISSEQGGASTTIGVASGAGLSVGCGNSQVVGQSNDATVFTDVNTPTTVTYNLNAKSNFTVAAWGNDSCITRVSAGFLAAGNCTVGNLGDSWGANFGFFTTGTRIANNGSNQYSSTATSTGAADLGTSRLAVGVIGVGNGTAGDKTAFIQSGNTVRVGSSGFTTANNTSLQTITGLSWAIPATALNWSFACDLTYSQATANAAVAFGIQAATNNPTNIYATGIEQITVGPPATFTTGTLATIATTTATNIVSGTPTATATNYTVHLGGTIENPASANAINIMVSTAAGADAVTVLRGSTCHFAP